MPVFICRKQMDALRCDMQATAAAPDALSSALLEHFGQSEFRPGQREVMFKMRLKSCAQRVTRLRLYIYSITFRMRLHAALSPSSTGEFRQRALATLPVRDTTC